MVNLVCHIFGHKWKVYHRKKSRTGTELNEFKKCKRCKHTVKMTIAMIHEERVREVAMGDLVCTGRSIAIPQMDKVTVADLIGEKGGVTNLEYNDTYDKNTPHCFDVTMEQKGGDK